MTHQTDHVGILLGALCSDTSFNLHLYEDRHIHRAAPCSPSSPCVWLSFKLMDIVRATAMSVGTQGLLGSRAEDPVPMGKCGLH